MHAWVVLLSLACGAEPLEDGTLLFFENCNSIVQRATRGSVGHVAIVMNEGHEPWVYEAIPGGVRRLTLDEYCAELVRLNARKREERQIRTFALCPEKPYTPAEAASMRHYLDEQLGRRYSVRSYLRGEEGTGIHCAELASHTLNESGRYQWEHCYSITPTSLQDLVDPTYRVPVEVKLSVQEPEETWCARTQRRWDSFRDWCGWGCGEAWTVWR